jgi:hypothetical protein
MAEDGLSVTLPLPMDVPSRVLNLLSLPPPGLVIWCLGAGGRTWHMESQEFGPWVQNASFSVILALDLPWADTDSAVYNPHHQSSFPHL